MATLVSNTLSATLDRLVRWVILPVTGVIPWLVSSGLLLLGFVALWVALLGALVVNPAAPEALWREIGTLPLVVQAVAWLLFLPLMGGLWVWATDWALVVRVVVIVAIAGWNLLVFIPRREAASPVAAQ